jgi:hypothetical protein
MLGREEEEMWDSWSRVGQRKPLAPNKPANEPAEHKMTEKVGMHEANCGVALKCGGGSPYDCTRLPRTTSRAATSKKDF